MATTKAYNLEDMLPGVLNGWQSLECCQWCHRETNDPIEGHDGFCPVPAVTLLARAHLTMREADFAVRPEGCNCASFVFDGVHNKNCAISQSR